MFAGRGQNGFKGRNKNFRLSNLGLANAIKQRYQAATFRGPIPDSRAKRSAGMGL